MHSVFIIDQDLAAINQIEDAVHWKGLHCKIIGTAAHAVEGMTRILKMRPDIIFTDIKLPDISGLEVIRRLSVLNYPGNYIIVTECEEFKFARMAIELGVSGYLLKPVIGGDVERTINKIIKGYRPPHAAIPDDDSSRLQGEIQKRGEEFSQPISAALCYIDRNIYSELSQMALCDVVSLSPSYFSRLFKKEVGMGFNEYIRLAKMNQAKKLLQSPQNKVAEVAEMLGYHNYNYFYQTFKKQFGYAPRQIKSGNHVPDIVN